MGFPISCVIMVARVASSPRICSYHLRRTADRSNAVFAFHDAKAATDFSMACRASSTVASGARSSTALVAGLMMSKDFMVPLTQDEAWSGAALTESCGSCQFPALRSFHVLQE